MMNKKINKASGLILTVLLTMSVLLSACGDTKGGSSSTEKPSGAATTEPVKEKVKLKILGANNVEEFPAGMDVNNNDIIKGIREKTGFDVQWELLPKDPEAVRQKLNVLMASGDTPDLIIMNDKSIFGSFVDQGLLTPLDDLLNEEGSNIKASFTPEQMKSATSDGKLYAIRIPTFSTPTKGLMVRKDWLDELGIQEPKTQDDFYEMLKTLKTKKPDAAPFTANLAQGLSSLEAITSMFYPPVDYVQKDGKVVYTPTEPAAKDFLVFANKLYNEGLIDKEAVVIKQDNLMEKMVSSKAAMSTIAWSDAKSIDTSLKEKTPGANLIYIDPPVGINGSSGLSKLPTVTKYFIIPKSSKHAKETIQFLDKASSEDLINFISFGEEGKHYDKKDGKFIATKEAENIRYRVYYNMFDTVSLGLQRMEQKGFGPYFNPLLKDSKYVNVADLVPPVTEVDKSSKELTDLRDEYFLKIITGALPITAYDEYVAKWKKAGGEEVLKALDAVYNSK